MHASLDTVTHCVGQNKDAELVIAQFNRVAAHFKRSTADAKQLKANNGTMVRVRSVPSRHRDVMAPLFSQSGPLSRAGTPNC